MATTFAAVNTAAFHAPDHTPNIETPTTPRQDASLIIQPPRGQSPADVESPDTPTRHSFAGVPGQRPLPSEPLTSTHTAEQTEQRDDHVDRGYSTRSAMSQPSADSDVEMGDGDGDVDGAEDDGSDNESITSESQQPSKKKKKGQRFFCTDFPPCQLSFTRSEHLARHIRHVLSSAHSRIVPLTSLQETHWRATVPVPLLPSLLPPRQSAAACPDCPCERGDSGRLPRRH